jgi:uncharacterized protein YndB with AHSA1/START domain
MLRWLGGCAAVAVVLVLVGICAGYQKINRMAAEGPQETVVVHAPAERVFTMVAHSDSLTEWRQEGLGIRASRPGILRAGDSVVIQTASGPARNMRATWHVSFVVPGVLIAFEMRGDSGHALATRKDSVIALGDSTQVISSLVATAMDSVRGRTGEGEGSAVVDMTSKLFISAGRLQIRGELLRLKARIEGDSLRPHSP